MSASRYSFSLTTFAPSGKLLQIEHALQAVNQGATSIGIKAKDGVVIATCKKPHPLMLGDTKIVPISHNIGMTYSGMGTDFRVLVDKVRKMAVEYKLQYLKDPPVHVLVDRLSALMQEYTQSGGVRPFGVSVLLIGFNSVDDKGLFQVDPSGTVLGLKASAIGKEHVTSKAFLERRYNSNLSIEDAIHMAVLTLKEVFNVNQGL
eukprot:NODE_11_length_54881_cov_1.430718.p30 type:complete len:204 gc:universal NODE_11_length_54881_cov_1.430718:48567-49178(+)